MRKSLSILFALAALCVVANEPIHWSVGGSDDTGAPKVLYSGDSFSLNNLKKIANVDGDLQEGGTKPLAYNMAGLFDAHRRAKLAASTVRRHYTIFNEETNK